MKTPIAKLSSNGQIVIPRKIRATMGLKPGAKFLVAENTGEIILKPIKDTISQESSNIPDESNNSSGTN